MALKKPTKVAQRFLVPVEAEGISNSDDEPVSKLLQVNRLAAKKYLLVLAQAKAISL